MSFCDQLERTDSCLQARLKENGNRKTKSNKEKEREVEIGMRD